MLKLKKRNKCGNVENVKNVKSSFVLLRFSLPEPQKRLSDRAGCGVAQTHLFPKQTTSSAKRTFPVRCFARIALQGPKEEDMKIEEKDDLTFSKKALNSLFGR